MNPIDPHTALRAASIESLHQGRYLHLVQRGTWEYATRPNATGVVVIVPIHDDGRIVLIEQYRAAVNANVIELPAGLAGDSDRGEAFLVAAQRELLEETGYAAREWVEGSSAATTPGLTDESVTFFVARGLTKTHEGGGVEGESIRIHEIARVALPDWLRNAEAQGKKVAATLFAGLWLAGV